MSDRSGAYGLALPDITDTSLLQARIPASWPPWRTRRLGVGHAAEGTPDGHTAEGTPDEDRVGPDHASFPVLPTGRLDVDRASATSVYRTPVALPDHALVHPHLAVTAAVAARWLGRQAFHAGAFLDPARGVAWGLLGRRGSGKSSTLLALALAGAGVLADDVLVLDGTTAMVGPRCLDLRRESAEHFGAGTELGVVGGRERWRLPLGTAVPAEVPLAGWVLLDWADRTELAPVPPLRRPGVLADNLALLLPPTDPAGFLALAALPVLRLTRPRTLGSLPAAVELLSGLARAATPPGAG